MQALSAFAPLFVPELRGRAHRSRGEGRLGLQCRKQDRSESVSGGVCAAVCGAVCARPPAAQRSARFGCSRRRRTRRTPRRCWRGRWPWPPGWPSTAARWRGGRPGGSSPGRGGGREVGAAAAGWCELNFGFPRRFLCATHEASTEAPRSAGVTSQAERCIVGAAGAARSPPWRRTARLYLLCDEVELGRLLQWVHDCNVGEHLKDALLVVVVGVVGGGGAGARGGGAAGARGDGGGGNLYGDADGDGGLGGGDDERRRGPLAGLAGLGVRLLVLLLVALLVLLVLLVVLVLLILLVRLLVLLLILLRRTHTPRTRYSEEVLGAIAGMPRRDMRANPRSQRRRLVEAIAAQAERRAGVP